MGAQLRNWRLGILQVETLKRYEIKELTHHRQFRKYHFSPNLRNFFIFHFAIPYQKLLEAKLKRLRSPDVKNSLRGKDLDAGKD